MSNKKNTKDNGIANFVAGMLSVLGVILFGVLPMVSMTSTVTNLYKRVTHFKGFSMILGGNAIGQYTHTNFINDEVVTKVVEVPEVSFNIGAFIAIMLVILGIIFTFSIPFIKRLSKNKYSYTMAGILMLIGGVLMYFAKDFALNALENADLTNVTLLGYFNAVDLKANLEITFGSIIAGTVACISGLINILTPFLKK